MAHVPTGAHVLRYVEDGLVAVEGLEIAGEEPRVWKLVAEEGDDGGQGLRMGEEEEEREEAGGGALSLGEGGKRGAGGEKNEGGKGMEGSLKKDTAENVGGKGKKGGQKEEGEEGSQGDEAVAPEVEGSAVGAPAGSAASVLKAAAAAAAASPVCGESEAGVGPGSSGGGHGGEGGSGGVAETGASGEGGGGEGESRVGGELGGVAAAESDRTHAAPRVEAMRTAQAIRNQMPVATEDAEAFQTPPGWEKQDDSESEGGSRCVGL
jgi:hypothetical protein